MTQAAAGRRGYPFAMAGWRPAVLAGSCLLIAATVRAGEAERLKSQDAAAEAAPALAKLAQNSKALGPAWSPAANLLPPAVLYHFGRQDALIEDAQARNVPQAVWDRFIMGGQSRYGLPDFRRGLYGCSQASWCEGFADANSPWVIAVHLKADCRSPAALAAVGKLPEDPRFVRWLKEARLKEFPSLSAFQKRCRNLTMNAGDGADGPCANAVARFFAEAGIRVVFDEAMPDWEDSDAGFAYPNSWYVRDRNCIETIEGTPEEELAMLAQPGYWENPAAAYAGGISGRAEGAIFAMILEALAGARAADRTVLDSLGSRTQGARDPLLAGTATVVAAYERCQDQGSLRTAQDRIQAFLNQVQASGCRSVPPELRTAFFDGMKSACPLP